LAEKEEEDDDDKNSNVRKDPFNISNDEYYNPKLATDSVLRTNVGGKIIPNNIRVALEWASSYSTLK